MWNSTSEHFRSRVKISAIACAFLLIHPSLLNPFVAFVAAEPAQAKADESRRDKVPSSATLSSGQTASGFEDLASEFKTDFRRCTVPREEILSGIAARDSVRAIDTPSFVSVEQADPWLQPREPVVLLERATAVKAYPLQILMLYEIVNHPSEADPFTVTYCSVCNSVTVFEGRRAGGRVLTFGTTGRLRRGNMLMYDRQTESWWQQATGESIAGELTGSRLSVLPSIVVSWEAFKTLYPGGKVLSRPMGDSVSHLFGTNPYPGYDDPRGFVPPVYSGPRVDERLPPMTRVIAVTQNNRTTAFTNAALMQERVINDEVGRAPIALFWQEGVASALESRTIAGGRDVGMANVVSRRVGNRVLTFRAQGKAFADDETGSTWSFAGQATSGPLRGSKLKRVVHTQCFWFCCAAFQPKTKVYGHRGTSSGGRQTKP